MHTKIKLTADGPRIIEANGRLGRICTVWAEAETLDAARAVYEDADGVVAESGRFARARGTPEPLRRR